MKNDLIRRQDVLDYIDTMPSELTSDGRRMVRRIRLTEYIAHTLPSAEPEMITIEELSNQLGCATIQSALYWFELLKTLDLLGFAIIRKETR